MFRKILIANRGEIACRIIDTAAKMGISTVAVYSDADRHARHVDMADEAVHIGPSSAADSYLAGDRIISACRQSGAQAVHPGYGFLSEQAEFCRKLEERGIIFIGPDSKAIAAMGDKIAAKKLAARAGVAVVPGKTDLINDADQAARIAEDIGFPVIVKASAGGGGKGMRIAYDAGELREGIERARSEAASSFADDRIFVEKYIERPRHIEIQILADGHGNCVHLGERECSIQRRNQKIIEEAPSSFLDDGARQAMGRQAVALARAVSYRSAGTVEFVVDGARNFYFLEMNTRLQVEHPVTELVTGIDIVEQMIRIAAGETLPFAQQDIRHTGWAVESRIYAENPARGFLPSAGRLRRYRPPPLPSSPDCVLRLDEGVCEGADVPTFYDPMIAKLSVHAPDRERAIHEMAEALDRFHIDGIDHNIGFLAAVMRHRRWRDGELSTDFIAEEYGTRFSPAPDSASLDLFCAAALLLDGVLSARAAQISGAKFAAAPTGARVVLIAGQTPRAASAVRCGAADNAEDGTGDGHQFNISVEDGAPRLAGADWKPGDPILDMMLDGGRHAFGVVRLPGGFHLRRCGVGLVVRVATPRTAELIALMPDRRQTDTARSLRSPMPGRVIALHVQEGESVQAGQTLAIVEAMKMENVLHAETPAKIARILVTEGDSLAANDVILEFDA